MNKYRQSLIYFLLSSLLVFSFSCKNSLIVKKRQHQKGYYVEWSKKELQERKVEAISKESIKTDISKIEELFTNIEDSSFAYVASVEEENVEEDNLKQSHRKYKSEFDLFDMLNQNTQAYTSAYSLDDLKNLRDRIKKEQRNKAFGDGLEIIIYLSLWIGLIVFFFFIEPVVAWILLGIFVVFIILVIWAVIAIGKAIRESMSSCKRGCKPPSGCH